MFHLSGPVCTFTGFAQPMDNLPTLNTMNGGRAVPVKFSLNDDQGLGILAAGYSTSQQAGCDTNARLTPIEQTDTAGQSGLSYDTTTDTYTYVGKTDKAWAGACRTFDLKLADGSDHPANFMIR